MDERCPLKLKTMPENWCPLAVLRLKALRNSEKELTEEEESKLPGCPYAINHQSSNYCFFKYALEYLSGSTPSDKEIAHMNSVSTATVRRVEKEVLAKIKESQMIQNMEDTYGDESIVDYDRDDDDNFGLLV